MKKMKRRIVPILGLGSLIVGLVALACSGAASAPTPTSTDVTPVTIVDTQEPVSSQTPITILDDLNPEMCSFIHNSNACFTDGQPPAGIPMSEYMGLFITARFDLRDQFDVELESVKIKSVERVEWNDASLGNPQPDMVYAQVITPGFKMVLDVQGETYTYHTSADRVVLVVDEQPDNQATGEGRAEIVKLVLEWALVDKNIPDYALLPDSGSIVLSLENIDADMVPQIPGVNLILLTPDEVQKKADEEGDLLFLSFQELKVGESKATVSINNTWAVSKESREARKGYLSGGGCALEYQKEGGEWVLGEQMMCWIS